MNSTENIDMMKSNFRSVKTELSLEIPSSKTKCKSNLFSIFNDLQINDEHDLYSISFAVNKNDSLVHRLIIHFKQIQTGELFLEFISHNSDTYKYFNLIKNYVDLEENSFSSVSPTESICVLDSAMAPFFDNQLLSMETSFFEIDQRMSKSTFFKPETKNEFKINMSKSLSLESDLKSSHTLDSNEIELHSNKTINQEDLDLIIMFLENIKRSGGGDVAEYVLDEKKRILKIKFEDYLVRDRVLSKKTLKIQDYTFNLRTPYNKKDFSLDNFTLILRNFKNRGDLDIVQMFAENLVYTDNEDNEIERVTQSKMFTDTYYIKFKLEFDHEKVERRLARKPTLFDRQISLFKAFKTNSIVIRMADSNEKLSSELIDLHFTNKKRSGISSYDYLLEKEHFIILTLDSNENIEKCLSLKHEISKKELLVEYLHNFDLLDEELTVNQTPVVPIANNQQAIIETPKVQVKELKEPVQQMLQSTLISQSQIFELPKEVPSFIFDLSSEPNASILKYWDEDQLKRLTNELLDQDAIVGKISNDYQIKIECLSDFKAFNIKTKADYQSKITNWETKIKQFVNAFFAEFKTQKIRVKNPIVSMPKIKYDKLRINIKKLDRQEFDSEYEIAGFHDLVESVIKSIQKENEEQDKLDKAELAEELRDLRLYQCRILFVTKYIKNMKDKYEDLQININAKNGTVKIVGTRHQIEDAKRNANDILKKIVSRTIPKSPLFIRLVTKKEKAIANWLKETPIQCVLEADSIKNMLTIYSVDQAIIEKFIREAKLEIIEEREFDLTIIDDKKFQNEIFNQLEDDQDIVFSDIDEKSKSVTLCGFKNKVEEVYEQLCKMT